MAENRSRVQELAQKSYAKQDPTGWFEQLYASVKGDEAAIPWASLSINSHLAVWLDRHNLKGAGKTALVVGCGLGDDAEALADLGFAVTGFDISPTAIAWCQRRFPDSQVDYVVDDLLNPSKITSSKFDLILESYTLQALPAEVRPQGMKTIAQLVAPQGTLLVICRGREPSEQANTLPFPLTKAELSYLETLGLERIELEDYHESEPASVRRFRIEYRLQA